MGLFKNMKDAMGQANGAMAGANQMQQQAEQQAGGISAGPGGMGAAVAAPVRDREGATRTIPIRLQTLRDVRRLGSRIYSARVSVEQRGPVTRTFKGVVRVLRPK